MQFERNTIRAEAKKDSLLRRFLKKMPRKRTEPAPRWQKGLVAGFAAMGILLILYFAWMVYAFFAHFSFGEILMLFGNLEKDENNRTQILLLGSGDANHDSPDLTDTIIVMSLNHNTNTVSMLSVPRDLWIEVPGRSGGRINKVFEAYENELGRDGAFKVLEESVSGVIDQDIQYYAKVDFTVFKKLVDAVGGVEVTMADKYCDEQYPDKELIGYDPFCIEAGTQNVDGEMALRLARSRHGYHLDPNGNVLYYASDFDRAARQQMILMAVKNKLQADGILGSATKMKEMYDLFNENVETNLGFREIWALAGFGLKLDERKMVKAVLNDDKTTMGGFLYAPSRDLYAGASVLRPSGESFLQIQQFVEMLFDNPEFYIEKARVEILNGTKIPGLAQAWADELVPFGFNVVSLGNTEDLGLRQRTTIVFPKDETLFPATRALIRNFVEGVVTQRTGNYSNNAVDVTIELGEDAAN